MPDPTVAGPDALNPRPTRAFREYIDTRLVESAVAWRSHALQT